MEEEKGCYKLRFPNDMIGICSSDLGHWLENMSVKSESNTKAVERKCKKELELQLRMILLIME